MASWPPKSGFLGFWLKMQISRPNPHPPDEGVEGQGPGICISCASQGIGKCIHPKNSGNPLGWKLEQLTLNPQPGHLGKVTSGNGLFLSRWVRIPSRSHYFRLKHI